MESPHESIDMVCHWLGSTYKLKSFQLARYHLAHNEKDGSDNNAANNTAQTYTYDERSSF